MAGTNICFLLNCICTCYVFVFVFVFGGQLGSVMGCPKDVAGAQTSNISYVTI